MLGEWLGVPFFSLGLGKREEGTGIEFGKLIFASAFLQSISTSIPEFAIPEVRGSGAAYCPACFPPPVGLIGVLCPPRGGGGGVAQVPPVCVGCLPLLRLFPPHRGFCPPSAVYFRARHRPLALGVLKKLSAGPIGPILPTKKNQPQCSAHFAAKSVFVASLFWLMKI